MGSSSPEPPRKMAGYGRCKISEISGQRCVMNSSELMQVLVPQWQEDCATKTNLMLSRGHTARVRSWGRYALQAEFVIGLKRQDNVNVEVVAILAAHKVSSKRWKHTHSTFSCESIWSGQGLDADAFFVRPPVWSWFDPRVLFVTYPPTLWLDFDFICLVGIFAPNKV